MACMPLAQPRRPADSGVAGLACALMLPSPPHVHPPPSDDGCPHPGGNRCQVTVPPHPGGIDTIANEQITAAYYAEFMTDQLLAVRRPRL